MTVEQWFVNMTLRAITGVLCRIDAKQMQKIPMKGPLIIVANHINFLEAPVVLPRAYPRPIATMAKVESWESPFTAYLFRIWGGIPIKRGEADLTAMRSALDALEREQILIILPEGTRSREGKLLRGKPGVSMLALRSKAAILPVVYYGNENFHRNFKRLRRTDVKVLVGNPFMVDDRGERVTSEVRQLIVDEIMYQLAGLLPEAYRGEYANLQAATELYLRFPDGSHSNLRPAPPSVAPMNPRLKKTAAVRL